MLPKVGPASLLTVEDVETYPDYHVLLSTEPVRGSAEVLVTVFLNLQPTFFSLLHAVAPQNVVLEEEI